MRVVDIEPRPVSTADIDKLRQIDDIAAHGKHAIDDNQRARFLRYLLQNPFELVEVGMHIALHLTQAQPAPVDYRRVIFLVGDDDIVAPYQRRNRPEIRLHAGGKHERRILAHKRGETFLKLMVKLERAIQKSASRAGRTEFFEPLSCSLPDLGMHGQTKIVVGTYHDQFAAMEDGLGSLEPVKRLEIGINPLFHGLLVQVELKTLLENVHKGPPEHAQIHSAAQFAGQQYAAGAHRLYIRSVPLR